MSDKKYPLIAFNVKEVITREDNKPYLIRRTLMRLGKTAPDGNTIVKKWYGPGSFLWRPANWAHRLELPTEKYNVGSLGYFYDLKDISCTTLIFTFKITRKWGFLTKTGWIYWKNYTKQKYC